MSKNVLFLWIAVGTASAAAAQHGAIALENPSFEMDAQAPGVVPQGWLNAGDPLASPPDIQPGFFGVRMPAQHGENYLGLVVRSDNTWEGVGQRLAHPLQKGRAYMFSVWLARSPVFVSAVRSASHEEKFTAPTVLKVWGYNTKTGAEELLAESSPVGHSQWNRFEFMLKPVLDDYDRLDLTAYYAPGFELQNGHLLLDNCSEIVPIGN